jgi:predicted Zn-dependent peptidase
MLWAEADRMRGLDITQENLTNQQGVVKNEVKVNVLNAPYGGFPWLDMPQYANTNWHNAHNFYGDLKDLDAATLEDVRSFFKTYYAPNNAVLVVVGDFETADAKRMVAKYFTGHSGIEDSGATGFDRAAPGQRKTLRETRRARTTPRACLRVSHACAQHA